MRWLVVFIGLLFSVQLEPAFAQIELKDVNGDGQVKAVAIGDSITAGIGDGVASGVFVEEAPIIPGVLGYPGRVENFLGILVDNKGVPGEILTDGTAYRFASAVSSSSPDYVFIMLGANDAIFRTDGGLYRAALQKLINIADVLGVQVVLMTPPPTCCERASLAPYIQVYGSEVRELAAVNEISYVDVQVGFQQVCPRSSSCSLLNQPEGLHPNTAGYDAIGRMIAEAVLGESLPVENENSTNGDTAEGDEGNA
ncbi:MAG: SGNH/GDSL hydrolase family protein [Bdellovibrionales bacterium]|nr:SGNH/GDSL hydrolase family protein [Bdellovibrionales bacterium]